MKSRFVHTFHMKASTLIISIADFSFIPEVYTFSLNTFYYQYIPLVKFIKLVTVSLDYE